MGKAIAEKCMNRSASPYRYVPLGHLALLGHHTGVAQIDSVTFGGLPAWLLWHLMYISRNPSWTRRVRLLVDWLLSTFLGPETGQLRLNTELQRQRVLEPTAGQHA